MTNLWAIRRGDPRTEYGAVVQTYDVATSAGTYRGVVANVVRCMLGRDLAYWERANGYDHDPSRPLSDSEVRDLAKYQEC